MQWGLSQPLSYSDISLWAFFFSFSEVFFFWLLAAWNTAGLFPCSPFLAVWNQAAANTVISELPYITVCTLHYLSRTDTVEGSILEQLRIFVTYRKTNLHITCLWLKQFKDMLKRRDAYKLDSIIILLIVISVPICVPDAVLLCPAEEKMPQTPIIPFTFQTFVARRLYLQPRPTPGCLFFRSTRSTVTPAGRSSSLWNGVTIRKSSWKGFVSQQPPATADTLNHVINLSLRWNFVLALSTLFI